MNRFQISQQAQSNMQHVALGDSLTFAEVVSQVGAMSWHYYEWTTTSQCAMVDHSLSVYI